MKKFTKLLALCLALVMVLACFAGCKKKPGPSGGPSGDEGGEEVSATGYTYRGYTTQLGTTWNPHVYETNYDRVIMEYLTTPLVDTSVKDSENGVYQWVFKAATSVTDVTKDHKDDLTKYKVTLPKGQSAAQTEKGYVFEIKLTPDMKWENGTAINADTYIDSMKALLDPTMMNYRANLYYSGEAALAGAYNYFYSLSKDVYSEIAYTPSGVNKGDVYMDIWTVGNAKGYTDANGEKCPWYVSISDATVYGGAQDKSVSGKTLYAENLADFANGSNKLYVLKANENYNENYAGTFESTVGCYKVDEYTIRYVTQTQIDYNYFLNACGSNWLVYKDLYEAGKDTSGKLVTTNYGTAKENTMSYGPYKLSSLQQNKQIVLVQNENYYAYEKKEDGTLYAETDYEIDGENVRAYQTTRIVLDVMTDDAAKQAFLKGALTEWTPSAEDMETYGFSDQLYQADETDTYSLFFNTDIQALKAMDSSKGNKNSVVLSNKYFRKAFSLSIDRSDWVTTTSGYKPSYSLLNNQFYYDVYNDPNSTYRSTDAAKQAMVDLYGVVYTDGLFYNTLDEAYDSINGYNLSEAKDLMKQACTQLVKDGLYTKGQDIKIRVAYSDGPLGATAQSQMDKLSEYLNEAAQGSGFGEITLEAVGDVKDRHDKVPGGEFAIGYGAWGGAAFYPFRHMQVYCDTQQNKINERACWNPATEQLTIQVDGQNVTKTWQDWSRALVGTGAYADAAFGTKLKITAAMEKEFLAKYYRIPLAASSNATLLSYQVNNFTDVYSIMYGFGGIELMTYNYNDAEWADYVAKAGGTLRYE